MSTAAGATAHIRNARGGQVAPAPQLHDDNSEMTAEQAEALRRAEEEGANMEADRTIGVYEEVKIKAAKITRKPWFVVDPRTSKLVPYWDSVGICALIFTAIVTIVEVSFVESPGCIDGLFLINRSIDVRQPRGRPFKATSSPAAALRSRSDGTRRPVSLASCRLGG